MKPTPPGGVNLLDEDEATGLLGGESRLRFLAARGFLAVIRTPRGPCFREDEVADLRAALSAPVTFSTRLRVGQAAYALGVTAETIYRAASEGVLHRDELGYFDSAEVRALSEARGDRKRLRAPAGESP